MTSEVQYRTTNLLKSLSKKYQFGDTNLDPNWVYITKSGTQLPIGSPNLESFYRDDVLGFSLFLVLSSPNLGSKLVSFRLLCSATQCASTGSLRYSCTCLPYIVHYHKVLPLTHWCVQYTVSLVTR
jgi:hypothetical protein